MPSLSTSSLLLLLLEAPASATCCKVCTVGKACGDTCISISKQCNTGPGCACDGGYYSSHTVPSPSPLTYSYDTTTSRYAYLNISSNPTGLEVFIDGKPLGRRTPLRAVEVPLSEGNFRQITVVDSSTGCQGSKFVELYSDRASLVRIDSATDPEWKKCQDESNFRAYMEERRKSSVVLDCTAPNTIVEVVKSSPMVYNCLYSQYKRQSTPLDPFDLYVMIAPSGNVEDSAIHTGIYSRSKMDECIQASLSYLAFPQTSQFCEYSVHFGND